MAPTATKSSAAKTKAAVAKAEAPVETSPEVTAPVAETPVETSPEVLELRGNVTKLQAENLTLQAKITELIEKLESLECSQRLWIKGQKDRSLYTVGTTLKGTKKISFYAAKSTKDDDGTYHSGGLKAMIATDNGFGNIATELQKAIDAGDSYFDFEFFENTYTSADGRGVTWYLVTAFKARPNTQVASAPAPDLDSLPF
jgi:hypothetical protein